MVRVGFKTFEVLSRTARISGRIPRKTAVEEQIGGGNITRACSSSAPNAAPWHHRMGCSQVWRQVVTGAKARSCSGASAVARRRQFSTSRVRRSVEDAKKSSAEVEPASLSARFKKLSREYGWAAVGVYLGLSVLDFPFCFLLVRTVGTEKIAHIEHVVVSKFRQAVPEDVKNWWREFRKAAISDKNGSGNNEASHGDERAGWGVEEAEKRHRAGASLATQLAFAYAIHKSFIFARIPLTAAITPRVVRLLRSWGWRIGKRRHKQR